MWFELPFSIKMREYPGLPRRGLKGNRVDEASWLSAIRHQISETDSITEWSITASAAGRRQFGGDT